MEISNPHDSFFKEIFSNKENASNFIHSILPDALKKNLDLSTLELDNNSYIDEELKENFSDIVYNCLYKAKSKVKVSLLFEHKSKTVKYPHLQLLRYILKIWETNIKQKEGLRPVIPIIFYHGKERWVVKGLSEYFRGIDEGLKRYIPEFDYLLTDLSRYSDEEIKGQVFLDVTLRIALLVMKSIYNEGKLREHIGDFLEIGQMCYEEEKGLKFLEGVIRYIYSSTEIGVEEVVGAVKKISEKGGEATMTTAMKLIEQGMQQGMQQGLQQGEYRKAVEAAKAMYSEGFNIDVIAKITGLSKEEINKVVRLVRQ
ncbi:MAG: Rpn family recombination-promoting nuclease/putative transposase [bacterium]